MSYAIQVGRLAASVVDCSGNRTEVAVFLHTVSPHQFPAETIADRLNDPDMSFLPCDIDGHTELIRLASISYVEVSGMAPEIERLEEIGAHRTSVRLELCCGETVEGELIFEAPSNTHRVSDLLNDRAPRFLLIESDHRTVLVRRDAVNRVRL